MAQHNKTNSNGSNSGNLHEENYNTAEIVCYPSQIVQKLQETKSLQHLIKSVNSIRYSKCGIESSTQIVENTQQYSLGYNMKFNKFLNHTIDFSIFYPLVMFPESQEIDESKFNKNIQQIIWDKENSKKETDNPKPIKNEQIKFGTLDIFYQLFSAKINHNKIQNNELKKLIKSNQFQDYEDCWILEFYQQNDFNQLEFFYKNLKCVGAKEDQIKQIFHNLDVILNLLQIYCRFIEPKNILIIDKNIENYQKQQDSQELKDSTSTQSSSSIKIYQLESGFKTVLEQLFENLNEDQIIQQQIELWYSSFLNKVTGLESNVITQNRMQGLIIYLYKITINIVEDIISIYLKNNFKILNQDQTQQQKDILLIQLPDYILDQKNHNATFQLLIDILKYQTIQMLSSQQQQQQIKQQELINEKSEKTIEQAKFDEWIKQNTFDFDTFFQIFGQQSQLNKSSKIIRTQLMWHQSTVSYRIQDIQNLIKFDITSKDKELILKSQKTISQKNKQSDNDCDCDCDCDCDQESQSKSNNKQVNIYQPTIMQKLMNNQYEYLKSALNSVEFEEIILENYKIKSQNEQNIHPNDRQT